ncbi:SAM-dependent methyltransferase [Variovorax rhizosphaerae]|uniref:S-adenosyl-L-methionine-dependent methyltransferase n=1 Tax=Variovorax rhizosphaerae TaxID=1836200 RepID=A0ABU8WYX1_9BURK
MNTTSPSPPLRNVSDTALWVAMYRAMESERPDALFDDPLARRMAGARGEAIVRNMPAAHEIAGPMTVRTAVIDEFVLACIEQGACTVINLGAGLDTRAFRLALPAALHWIDVDLPDMVVHRRICLGDTETTCRHSHMVADVCDALAVEAVLSLARSTSGPVLVLTEGLLLYLTENQVARLAAQLFGEPQVGWWIGDLISLALCATSGSLWQSQLTPDATFQFAPRDRAGFFAQLGWHEREFRSTWDESIRFKRAQPWAAWWTVFGQPHFHSAHESLRQASGVSLFEAR